MMNEIIFDHYLLEGNTAKTSGKVLKDAEFFQDHFPEFPILPGVLALDIIKKTADHVLSDRLNGRKAVLKAVRTVKFARYLQPGDCWESEATILSEEGARTTWKGKLLRAGEQAVSARFELELI